MDNFNSGKIKEMVYDVLQNPTRENFIDILDNGLGEQDNFCLLYTSDAADE